MRRQQTRTNRGSSIAEALVAASLAGIAFVAVVLTARQASFGLARARDAGAALALAEAELELLRAAPKDDGTDDVTADGVRFSRTWSASGGRGRATRLAVEVTWRDRRLALETAVLR